MNYTVLILGIIAIQILGVCSWFGVFQAIEEEPFCVIWNDSKLNLFGKIIVTLLIFAIFPFATLLALSMYLTYFAYSIIKKVCYKKEVR